MQTDRAVQAMLRCVHACVDADLVVLFGSAAHRRARPDSDIDLLVVARCGTGRTEVLRELRRGLAILAVPVDVHLVPPESFEGSGYQAVFLRSIVLDGTVLYHGPALDMERALQTLAGNALSENSEAFLRRNNFYL